MPIGIVSDAEFQSELQAQHVEIKRGRGPTAEVPEVIREVVAEEVIENGNDSEVAKAFGISRSSVSAYKNGATSTASYNNPDERLLRSNNKVRSEISEAARLRLKQALQHITPEKLAEAKLRDVSAVAKDMSAVVKDQEGNITEQTNIGAQFVFHVPRQKEEADFEVIDV